MKVKFSKAQVYKPEWNGNGSLPANEQVTVVLAPMRFEDVMAVMDAMGGQQVVVEAQSGEDAAKDIAKKVDLKEFLSNSSDIITRYATDLVNLEGDDGPLTVADIVNFPTFMQLAFEIIMKLVTISMPTETAEGNSEGQSA